MDRLWAPWRMKFIGSGSKDCVFCSLPLAGEDKKSLILSRGHHAFVMMNRYPYNNGHLMVAPFRHVLDPGDLKVNERLELWNLIGDSMSILRKTVRPSGFNIGANIGRASGAGFEHLHMHIVPRWDGDTNFMPILGEAKVIPEYLEETYEKLLSAFPAKKAKRKGTVALSSGKK
ncbi:MAG: HIT domain-containing protein [Conexivisphaerales archaeon]